MFLKRGSIRALGLLFASLSRAEGKANLDLMSFGRDIDLHSSLGQKLVKIAEKVDVDNEIVKEEGHERKLEAYGMDTSWLPSYSLKVLGCSHVTSWNEEAVEGDDAKLTTKRLIRFRLCPSDECNSSSGTGCQGSSYGDYIIDIDLFLMNYWEWLQDDIYSQCQEYAWKKCNCYDDDGKDDNFDQSQCEFQCWYKTGKKECYVDYTADDDSEGFQLDNYFQCSPWYPPGYNRRKLEEDQAEQDEQEEEQDEDDNFEVNFNQVYYMGPHCQNTNQVYMGLFTDDACTVFADKWGGTRAYEALTGSDLPYSGNQPLIQQNCMSCSSQDDDYIYQARMVCKGSYVSAGKCETHLDTNSPNEAGCNFINGVTYIEQYAKPKYFNPFSYIFSWMDDYPTVSMSIMGIIFAASIASAYVMKSKLKKIDVDREKSKEIAFNAAQVESHYTDVKVKDAFLAM